MTADVSRKERAEHTVASSARENFYQILSRTIEATESDPAQLRKIIYELARAKLKREGWQRDPPVGIWEMRNYIQGLEGAIDRIEFERVSYALAAEQELRALLSQQRLISNADVKPNKAVLTIDYQPVDPAYRKPGLVVAESTVLRRSQVARKWIRSATAPLLRVAVTAIFGAALYAALAGGFRRPQNSIDEPATGKVPDASEVIKSSPEAESIAAPFLPLPAVYGVYAIKNGHLSELEALSIKVPDQKVFMSAPISAPSQSRLPDGKLTFIAFRRDLVANAPERVTIRVVAKVMRGLSFSTAGKPIVTKVDNLWAVRSNSYEFRVAPMSEKPEMITIRPQDEDFVFPPGRYALMLKGQAYDFSVEGDVTDPAQCLERTDALNGAIYSECR